MSVTVIDLLHMKITTAVLSDLKQTRENTTEISNRRNNENLLQYKLSHRLEGDEEDKESILTLLRDGASIEGLRTEIDVSHNNSLNENALHYVIKYRRNCDELYTYLAKQPNVPEALKQKSDENLTPMELAIKKNQVIAVKSFIAFYSSEELNAKNQEGNTLLHLTCEEGNSEIITILLNHGADINASNINGNTPLHVAASKGNSKAIECLLSREHPSSVEVDKTNLNGVTPLAYAIQNKRYEAVRIIATHLSHLDTNSTKEPPAYTPSEAETAKTTEAIALINYMINRSQTKKEYRHYFLGIFGLGYSKQVKISAASKKLSELFAENNPLKIKKEEIVFSDDERGALRKGALGNALTLGKF